MATQKPTAEQLASTKVIIKNVRLSYVHVWEAVAMADGQGKPKFSVSVIIPKDHPQLDEINAAIEAAKQNGKATKFGGKFPANLKMPLRDGDVDRPEDEAYEKAFFVTASSGTKPGIVDKKRQKITDETEVYSGIYANVSMNFYPFNAAGSKGVACGLNNIQKVDDGEALGGRPNAEDEFDEIEEEDEDLMG